MLRLPPFNIFSFKSSNSNFICWSWLGEAINQWILLLPLPYILYTPSFAVQGSREIARTLYPWYSETEILAVMKELLYWLGFAFTFAQPHIQQ